MTNIRRSSFARAAWLLAPWAGALALAGGCGDGGGAGGSGGAHATVSSSATGTAPACGLAPLDGASCEACMTASCCAQMQACAGDKSCRKGLDCYAACSFEAVCAATLCSSSFDATPAILDLEECALTSCSEACPQYAPGCEYANTLGGAACDACVKADCCDTYAIDVDSLEYQKCKFPCLDAACLRACEVSHPAAMAKASARGICFTDTCKAGCQSPEGCGAIVGMGACGTCIHDQCCAAYEACSRDWSCVDLFEECLMSCIPGFDCDDCLAAWPAAEVGLALAMANCSSTTCVDSCGSGQECGLFASSEPTACQSCIHASCCAESSDCGLDADCASLRSCVELCHGDATCAANCKAALPNGSSLFDPLVACEAANCPACE